MRGQRQSVQPGTLASIGIGRTLIDNSELEFSAIGRMECTMPGTTDTSDVDVDLIFGLVSFHFQSKKFRKVQKKSRKSPKKSESLF
jgi:hypothetical protein